MAFYLAMIVVFILGYTAIALEHPLKINKAASALLTGSLLWVLYMLGAFDIFTLNLSHAWNEFSKSTGLLLNHENIQEFLTEHEIIKHLGEIGEILFFLLGAMTIVEITDQHQGFRIITDRIKTTNKVKLLWLISFVTFFLSAILDNLTTTIVMVTLIRKLINDHKDRLYFASTIVIAANAGGAFSPIGDVTTIMLWIGGQVTTVNIILKLFIPSVINLLIPLIILSFMLKGTIERPNDENSNELEEGNSHSNQVNLKDWERNLMFFMGVGGLIFVPIFKTVTHLPPFMGMLFSLSIIWITVEILHMNKPEEDKLSIHGILSRIDTPTILFFLGILSAVAALQSAGHLIQLSHLLDKTFGDVFIIGGIIGVISAIVDNVPLVAAAMGMYPIMDPGTTGYMANFVQDGVFWEYLAYTAGTGGSMLIIGSAAGVAAMGIEKIEFIWYMKKISWLAFLGYIGGIFAYYFQIMLLG
ncbi:MAG: sodium:proton antiporter NhaD [Bacteroidales bacterium]|nr:sodium:proton antiporter NhaD [Bacteroidales bacterium]